MDASNIRRLLADPDTPGSLADRARTRRRRVFLEAFPHLERMTVLDIGGTAGYWRHLGLAPDDLTLLNIVEAGGPGIRMIVGDACEPPAQVLDRTYDLVVCNSTIDQVGGFERRRQLADVISRAGDAYWVQTANRGFPLDAYFLFPWFSAFPVEVRVAILRRWKLTHMHTRDPVMALHRVMSVELQSERDMIGLFPDARIIRERFCGVTKSLVAIRGST